MSPDRARAEKTCLACGRTITWRKKWERDWDQVRYCSSACRRHGVGEVDRELEAAIRTLVDQRAVGASICPSEAARHVAHARDVQEWRDLMEPARRAARRLVASGDVEILQGGRVVDPSTARGPVRIRRAPSAGDGYRLG